MLIPNRAKEGAVGFCGMTDDNRTFEIEIDSKMGINELVTTVCHEMVHVKQYARNEMTDECVQYGAATWKGRKVNPKTTYYDLPWEIEAHGRETGLFIRYIQQHNLCAKAWTKSAY